MLVSFESLSHQVETEVASGRRFARRNREWTRIAERHRAERVALAFAERHAQVETIAALVLATDRIGTAEPILEVMTELVRDHVRIELVRVAALPLAKSPRI